MSCLTFCFFSPPCVVVFSDCQPLWISQSTAALSEAIVKLTGEGMGKIVNNPQSD